MKMKKISVKKVSIKRLSTKRKSGFPALSLFMCGFLLGNLLPNFLWKAEYRQKTITSIYLINTFADRGISDKDYLMEILRMRGSCYILSAVCAYSVFGVPLAAAGSLLLGLQTGIILAMSVLEFGFAGGLVGASLLFPQYLFYIPTALLLMTWVYTLSLDIWKTKSAFPQKSGRYTLKFLLGAIACTAGILSECYINPWLVQQVLKLTKIF